MLFTHSYILDERGEPVAEPDIQAWAEWFAAYDRHLGWDDLGVRGQVSTVFLATDHNFAREGAPVLWETMIFGGPLNMEQARYSSRSEALQGHADIVQGCRALPLRAVWKHYPQYWYSLLCRKAKLLYATYLHVFKLRA